MRHKFTIILLLVLSAFAFLYSSFGPRSIYEGATGQQPTATIQNAASHSTATEIRAPSTARQLTPAQQAQAQQDAVDQNLGKLIDKCNKGCNAAAPVGKKNVCFKNCFENGGNVKY